MVALLLTVAAVFSMTGRVSAQELPCPTTVVRNTGDCPGSLTLRILLFGATEADKVEIFTKLHYQFCHDEQNNERICKINCTQGESMCLVTTSVIVDRAEDITDPELRKQYHWIYLTNNMNYLSNVVNWGPNIQNTDPSGTWYKHAPSEVLGHLALHLCGLNDKACVRKKVVTLTNNTSCNPLPEPADCCNPGNLNECRLPCPDLTNSCLRVRTSYYSPPGSLLFVNKVGCDHIMAILRLVFPDLTCEMPCCVIPALTLNQNVCVTTNVSCSGGSDGGVIVTVTGGQTPYAYMWSNQQTTSAIDSLPVGPYTVTVTDASGATVSATFTVTEPPALAFTAVTVTNASCNGTHDGNIHPLCTGGTPPYTWETTVIDHPYCQPMCDPGFVCLPPCYYSGPPPFPNGISSGSYLLKVTDAHGCAFSQTQTVGVDPSLPVIVPFSQGFEVPDFPPDCWTNAAVSGSFVWNRTTNASGNGIGTGSVVANFFDQGAGTYELTTMPFQTDGLIDPVLRFNYAYATYVNEVDELDIYYSTNSGSTWTLLLAMPGGLNGILNTAGAYTNAFIPTVSQWDSLMPGLPGGLVNMLKFTAVSAYGNNLYLDNIAVMERPPVIPLNNVVQNVTITGSACYNASNTLTVAGNGTSVTIESGGSVNMIGGNHITVWPSTVVQAGGYLHAYIAPVGPWCGEKSVSMIAIPEGSGEPVSGPEPSRLKIYPNPTTGDFVLEPGVSPEGGDLSIEVSDVRGKQVLSARLHGQKSYSLSLAGKPDGVYFVRVISVTGTGTGKIIKH